MPRSPEVYLRELEKAARYLIGKAEGLTLDEYRENEDLQAMVERHFIRIGETMAQLRRSFPAISDQFADASQIVGFRNFIIHQYWDVDHREVWDTLTSKIEPLLREVEIAIQRLPPTL